jgi:hypothetical protein
MNDCRRGYARRRHERQSGRSWKTYHVLFTGCISNFILTPHHLLAATVIIGGLAGSNRPSVGWRLEKLMLTCHCRQGSAAEYYEMSVGNAFFGILCCLAMLG